MIENQNNMITVRLLSNVIMAASLLTTMEGKVLNVEIAAIGYYSHPQNLAALVYSLPAMELAIEEVNAKFNNSLQLTLKPIYNRRHANCPQYLDDVQDMAAKWYYLERQKDVLSVVISPGKLN